METISARLRQLIEASPQRMLQGEIAERVGMTAVALSLAINGKRHLSSLELVNLAELLGVSTYWLITGENDPFEPRIAARHGYDSDAHGYVHEPAPEESELLANIVTAYRQAFPQPVPVPAGPGPSASKLSAELGAGFAVDFASRVEERLGVGIVRVPGVDKAYSLRIGGRHCIVLGASPNWFFQNFSIAHELGHINLGHFDDPDERATHEEEREASNFAAELLLPAALMQEHDWMNMSGVDLANFVWQTGVSTHTLRVRLSALKIRQSPDVELMLQSSTQVLLRQQRAADLFYSPRDIAARMSAAATRRFPAVVEAAHLEAIGRGALAKDTLAWMLGVLPDALEVPTPQLVI